MTGLISGAFEHDTFTKNMPLDIFLFDNTTGKIEYKNSYVMNENYGFICASQNGKYVYAVDTRLDQGSVVAYEFKNGSITIINKLALEGAVLGLHCVLSTDDNFLIASFGTSSQVYSIRLGKHGEVETVSDVFTLPEGVATLPRQKSGPAPHQAMFDRTGKYLLIPDIHTDRLYSLSFDNTTGKMEVKDYITIEGGQGPRHVVFHPNNKWVYLLTEMGTSVYGFEFNSVTGKLTQKERLSLVPRDYILQHVDEEIQSGEITISPDGHFILASMRNYYTATGKDRIFSIELDQETGRMVSVESFSSHGHCPRMIAFSTNGSYLLVGNKSSNEIVSFAYNKATGKLNGICSKVRATATSSICFVNGPKP